MTANAPERGHLHSTNLEGCMKTHLQHKARESWVNLPVAEASKLQNMHVCMN